MTDQQRSPWADGDGLGASSSAGDQPAAARPYASPESPPRAGEPPGWASPQFFGNGGHDEQSVEAAQPALVQFGQRMPYGYGTALPEHPSTTPAMVLGIIGLVGFPFLGPLAWYVAAKARREIASQPGRYRDSGKLTAGLVMGIIATALLALGALFWTLLILLFMAGA